MPRPPRRSLHSLLLMAASASSSAAAVAGADSGLLLAAGGHRIRLLHSFSPGRVPRWPEVASCMRAPDARRSGPAPAPLRSRNFHSASNYAAASKERLRQLIQRLKNEGINPKQWRLGNIQRMLCPQMDIDNSMGSGTGQELLSQAADSGKEEDAERVKDNYDATPDEELMACAAFHRGVFKEALPPVLPRPQPLSRQRGGGANGCWCHSFQPAAGCTPVSGARDAEGPKEADERVAVHGDTDGAPDKAANEFIDLYGRGFTDKAVDKIRAAASLGNSRLAKALAAVAAEVGMLEMEAI